MRDSRKERIGTQLLTAEKQIIAYSSTDQSSRQIATIGNKMKDAAFDEQQQAHDISLIRSGVREQVIRYRY